MTKNKGGRGFKSADSRRNSPRIAISPSIVAKIDIIIATIQGETRADFLERLINREFSIFESNKENKVCHTTKLEQE